MINSTNNNLPRNIESQEPLNISKNSFFLNHTRIKKIAAITLLGLGGSFSVAAIIAVSASSLGIIPSMLIIGASTTTLTIVGIKALRKITPLLPKPFQKVSFFIQSTVGDVFGAIALAALFPLNLEKYNPKTKDDTKEGEIPVLFIHGFLGSSNNWLYHWRRLKKSRLKEPGYTNLFSVNLGNPLSSIEEYSQKVRDMVEEIKELMPDCKEIILVCHSMGGLVGEEYLYTYAEKQKISVREFITLGTPLAGTILAYIASLFSKAAREMKPNSPLIQKLQAQSQADTKTKFFHVGTKTDFIIRPRISATTKANEQANVHILNATGHIGYLFSDEIADTVLRTELQKENSTILV